MSSISFVYDWNFRKIQYCLTASNVVVKEQKYVNLKLYFRKQGIIFLLLFYLILIPTSLALTLHSFKINFSIISSLSEMINNIRKWGMTCEMGPGHFGFRYSYRLAAVTLSGRPWTSERRNWNYYPVRFLIRQTNSTCSQE